MWVSDRTPVRPVRRIRQYPRRTTHQGRPPGVRPQAVGRTKRPKTMSTPHSQAASDARKALVREALQTAGGNVTRAARALGISRQALSEFLGKHPEVTERIPLRSKGRPRTPVPAPD